MRFYPEPHRHDCGIDLHAFLSGTPSDMVVGGDGMPLDACREGEIWSLVAVVPVCRRT